MLSQFVTTLQAMEGSYNELAQQLQGSSVRVAKFQADVDREFAQEKFGLKTFPTIVMLPKATSQVRPLCCCNVQTLRAHPVAQWRCSAPSLHQLV